MTRRPDILHYIDAIHHGIEREIDTRAAQTEAEIDRRVTALQQAAADASAELKQRLDGMNEFRLALSDQYARAVTRNDFETAVDALTQRLEAVIAALAAKTEAAAQANSDRINLLEQNQDRQRGRQLAYGGIAAISGVLITLFILVAGHIHIS